MKTSRRARRSVLALVGAGALVMGLASVAYADSITVSGVVTDRAGHPLAGITVTLTEQSTGMPFTATSTSSGRYSISLTPSDPGGTDSVTAQDPAGVFIGQTWAGIDDDGPVQTNFPPSVPLDHSTSGVNFTLNKGAQISGRVLDAGTGQGIAGASVNVPGSPQFPAATTAADGGYVLKGLWPDTDRVAVTVNDGRVAQPGLSAPVALSYGQSVTGVNFSAPDDGAISGTVTYPSAADGPCFLNVYHPSGKLVSRTGASSCPQGGGAYSVVVPPGQYKLAIATGFGGGKFPTAFYGGADLAQATVITVANGQAVSGKNVAVALGGQISGTVTGPGGTPLAGASLEAHTGPTVNGYDTMYSGVPTDSNGRYTILGLPTGNYKLRVSLAAASSSSSSGSNAWYAAGVGGVGSESAASNISVTQSGTTTVNLGTGVVSGRITTSDTHTGLANAAGTLYLSDSSVGSVGVDANGAYAVPVLAGTYKLQMQQSYDSQNVQYAGIWYSNAADASHATPITVSAGHSVVANVTQTPFTNVAMSVTASGQEVPSDVSFIAYNSAGSAVANSYVGPQNQAFLVVPLGIPLRFALVSPNGRFKTDYYDGKATLAAATPVTLTRADSANTVTTLNPQVLQAATMANAVSGSVADALTHAGLNQAELVLTPTSTAQTGGQFGLGVPYRITPDATTGAFNLTDITPGTYHLTVSDSCSPSQIAAFAYGTQYYTGSHFSSDAAQAATITIPASGTTNLGNLTVTPLGQITGHVYNADGTPLGATSGTVLAMSTDGHPIGNGSCTDISTINSDGSYTVTGIPTGTPMAVLVRASSPATDVFGINETAAPSAAGGLSVDGSLPSGASLYTVSPGQVLTGVDVHMTGGTVHGTVTDSVTHQPLPNAQVSAINTAPLARGGFSTTSDANGHWSAPVSVGRYTITIDGTAATYNTADRTVSVANGQSVSVDTSLTQSGTLKATVTAPTGVGTQLVAIDASGLVQGGFQQVQARSASGALPPGQYQVCTVASPGSSLGTCSPAVAVTAGHTTNVSMALTSPGTTASTIALSGAGSVTTGSTATFTATVGGAGSAPAGYVEFRLSRVIDSAQIAAITRPISAGAATAHFAVPRDVPSGAYVVTASYGGDAAHAPSSSNVGLNLHAAAPGSPTGDGTVTPQIGACTTAPNLPQVVNETSGHPFKLVAGVCGAGTDGRTLPTGTVTVYRDSAVLATAPIEQTQQSNEFGLVWDADAHLQMPALPPGTYYLKLNYSGDRNYAPSHSVDAMLILSSPGDGTAAAATSTSLAASATSVTSDQLITFTATVSAPNSDGAPTGPVLFYDQNTGAYLGASPVSGGTATFTTTLTPGPFGGAQVVAYYLGDSDFAASSSIPTPRSNGLYVKVTGSLPPSSLDLLASSDHVAVGAPITLIASVLPSSAHGTVSFVEGSTLVGSTVLSGGVARLTTSTLPRGTHSITAFYAPQGDYQPSSSTPISVTIGTPLTTTSTTVAASSASTTAGQSVTFTATVAPSTATGTVTFKDGTTTLGTGTLSNGSATLSTSSLTTGSHSVTASYGGDANNAPSTSDGTSVLVKAVTTTTLTTSSASVTAGQPVTFTATVAPSTATGTVTFKDGTTSLGTGTLSGGIATLQTSTLATGSHAVTAAYVGDSAAAASTSPAATVTVSPATAATTTTLSTSTPSLAAGSSVTFTAHVSPSTATGAVTFSDGATLLGSGNLSGGVATFATSSLGVGTHSVIASYAGDASDGASTSPALTVMVTKVVSTTALSSSTTSPGSGQRITLTATVAPSSATGTVTFLDGSTVIGSGPLLDGVATFTTSALAVGTHSITAAFAGDGSDAASTSSPTVVTVSEPTLTTAIPTITGTAKVGSVLTALPGAWAPTGVSFSYQWNANGTPVSGARQSTFTLSAAQVGKLMTVTVTGAKPGYRSAAATSHPTASVTKGTLKASRPAILGTAKVGKRLTVNPGVWGPAPVAWHYQWYANGHAIKGASKATVTLSSALRGKRITVRIVGTKPGYVSLSETSSATKPVAR